MITQPFLYKAKVIKVLDGDTVRLNIDLGFSCFHVLDLRLEGFSAPELDEPDGMKCKGQLERLLSDPTVMVHTVKTQNGTDKRSFARYIGTIYNQNEDSINMLMRRFYPQGFGVWREK
jgi:micrococcal nuclease